MYKFIGFNFDLLNKERIATLRVIGKKIGVKSPTSKNKEVLIEEIIAIQKNEKEPIIITEDELRKTKINLTDFLVKIEEELPDEIEMTKDEEDNGDKPYEFWVKNYPDYSHLKFRDSEELFDVEGIFEQHESGFGFLRVKNYEISSGDVYISNQNIRKYQLKSGDKVKARAKFSKEGNSAAVNYVVEINNAVPGYCFNRLDFDRLNACYPTEKFNFGLSDDVALRCIDIFAPIGKGQRGLIVAPPKVGKTTLIKKIAKAIETYNKDVVLMVLLIDERPEEVTDIKESIESEVISSTFDKKPEHHIRVAKLAAERAKRLAEFGTNVVILLDSITRLTRAYNNVTESTGKVLTGGLDPNALAEAKQFFGSARNTKESGSITILATALVDTGSRMDDIIFEEFKSTGNMEIYLSRELSERRIFPAIDIYKSGTRNEEKLLTEEQLVAVYKIRKILNNTKNPTDSLIEMIKKTKDNDDLLLRADSWLKIFKA